MCTDCKTIVYTKRWIVYIAIDCFLNLMWLQVVGQFTWCHYTNIADDVNITSLKITQSPTWLYPLPVAGHLITRTRATTERFGHCWHQKICVFPRKLQALSCFPACKRVPFTPSTLLGINKLSVASQLVSWPVGNNLRKVRLVMLDSILGLFYLRRSYLTVPNQIAACPITGAANWHASACGDANWWCENIHIWPVPAAFKPCWCVQKPKKGAQCYQTDFPLPTACSWTLDHTHMCNHRTFWTLLTSKHLCLS